MSYTRNGDIELYYETFGDPAEPALLLINGLGSQCINFPAEWCQMFAGAGFQVIRYDNRDVGLSTHLHDAPSDVAAMRAAWREGRQPEVAYTLADMALDAVAVLDAAGVERAHVLGVSMGGMIAQTLAIEHPARVITLISVMSTTGERDAGRSSPQADEVFALPPPSDRQSAIERDLLGARTWGSPGCYDEDRIAAKAAAAFDRSFDPAGRTRQLMAIMASPSRADGLRQLQVPTLVIHGSEDKLIDPSGGRRTAELVPGARFEVLHGMGHDYPPEYWRQWVDLVAGHAKPGR